MYIKKYIYLDLLHIIFFFPSIAYSFMNDNKTMIKYPHLHFKKSVLISKIHNSFFSYNKLIQINTNNCVEIKV